MIIRYLNIFLIICMIASYGFMCSGCSNHKKSSKIVIKHESRLAKYKQKNNNSIIIDLSDGKKVNFNTPIGPNAPSGPNFDVIHTGLQ